METKEWIGIKSLEEIDFPSGRKLVVLLEDGDGARYLAHVIRDLRGKYKLRGYTSKQMKKRKVIAYYGIGEWKFCLLHSGTDLKIPNIDTEHNCEAYTLWGDIHGGCVPIEHQIVHVINGHPYLDTGWPGSHMPDFLLGYHVLPDMYLYESKKE